MTGQGKTRETKNESIAGHGRGSKIDFLFDAYSAVARYTRAGRNREMRFQTIKVESGLPNNYQVTSSNLDKYRVLLLSGAFGNTQ